VRQLRHALGVRLRRRHRHLKAKPEAQAAFVATRASLLAALPADGEVILVEEATRRRHPTLTTPWCWVDDGPAGPTGDDHPKVHV